MRRTTRIRRGLLSWLTNAALPVFVLDDRRVVLFFNRGCEQLTGWTAADLIGQVCEYTSSGDPLSVQTMLSRLCPPPEIHAGLSSNFPAEFLHRDGTSQLRSVHYFVLQESADAPVHILGVIGPPDDLDATGAVAAAARQHADLAALCSRLHREFGEQTLIGTSSTAHRLREQVKVAAASSASVHLHGETGVGCQQLARLVHARSERRDRAFVPLQCDRIAPIELKLTLRRLLNAEDQPAEASLRAGTVYLQAAGELPRDVQELLVAQWASRTSLGWQLISREDRPLAELLAEGRLLSEYVDRLSEIVIAIPPLRARRDDLPLIAQHRLEALNVGAPQQIGGFAPDVLEQFSRYGWPGNLTELEAVIREAHAACKSSLVTLGDLPFRFRTGMDAQTVGPSLTPQPVNLEDLLARVETEHIRWALSAAKSNKSQAAALLGLTRPRLYRRMEALGIADEHGQP